MLLVGAVHGQNSVSIQVVEACGENIFNAEGMGSDGAVFARRCPDSQQCTMANSCSNQGRCMGDGSCECFPGWSGDDCSNEVNSMEVEEAGDMNVTCDVNATCGNRGRCAWDETCECFEGFSGADCSIHWNDVLEKCPKFRFAEGCEASCNKANHCSDNGECNFDGSCMCFEGWTGHDCSVDLRAKKKPEQCLGQAYGMECESECSMAVSCSSNGRCMGDGSCLCFPGWTGLHCNHPEEESKDPCSENVTNPDAAHCRAHLRCDEGLFGDDCFLDCTMASTCSNNGRCMGDGSCMCFPGFSGVDCSDDVGAAEAICEDGVSSVGCKQQCTMASTCSNNGRCMGDGSCLCFDSWDGHNCTIRENSIATSAALPLSFSIFESDICHLNIIHRLAWSH